ncbi:fatty-acid--CoA ligase [Nocardia seriolae]|nr:AMP-binding protein [Nocardia seriolae]OJF81401.1 fatty-acid--CoA ligase [Nocardia seriolae]
MSVDRTYIGRAVRAVPAILTSGMLRPLGPRAVGRTLRGLWRFGPSPAMLLAFAAARNPLRTAVIYDRGAISYGELQRRAEAIAAALHAHAHGRVGTVAILCRNHAGFVAATAAGAQLGAELVFINTELPAAALAALLRRHSPDILIADQEYDAAIAAADYPGLHVRAWVEAGGSGALSLEALAAERHPAPPAVHRPVRITLLTSGTSGFTKGVPRAIPLRSILELATTGAAATRMRAADTVVTGPPMFHGFGLAALMATLALGATTVCHRRFDAARTLADIDEHGATVLFLVPVMVQRLVALSANERAAVDVSRLRRAITGAAPIAPATVAAFVETYGPILVNGYGSTETGVVAIATPEDLLAEAGTVGKPALGVSVRILRADRTNAAPGEVGSIFIRSGLVFTGYTPDPHAEERAKEVVDGYVDTGDLGHLDDAGRLYVDGRSDDMIVSGGENIFPGEVENRLAAHPALADVVVLGVPNPEYGQTLRAFVVLVPGARTPTTDDLNDHVRAALERYKVPKEYVFLDRIPRNASGKVLRKNLAAASAGTGS